MRGPTDKTDRVYLPEWPDMQGLVLSAYPELDQAKYLLFTVRDRALARRWLRDVFDRVTPALRGFKRPGRKLPVNVNIAFTAPGLRILCGTLSNFSDTFMEGIHGCSHRRRVLGDIGESEPVHWRWGNRAHRVHMLLMVFAHADAWLEDEVRAVMPPPGAMRPVEDETACRLGVMDGREHFGFKDGISQPIIAGSLDAERFPDSIHIAPLGEFVLGYPDASGIVLGETFAGTRLIPLPAVTGRKQFGRNGTYLVLRQLAQEPRRFWWEMERRTVRDGQVDRDAAERLASKLIGRRRDGTPLLPYASINDNEFGYGDDPYGHGCPIGAHIRRSNPRNTFENNNVAFSPRNDHRILRRGRSYVRRPGSTEVEHGLLFLCLNADIERQFEFIQQNWINNTSFAGLSDEEDPLIGNTARRRERLGTLTIGSLPAPLCVRRLPRFVTVKGGQYFFLPGMSALKWMGHA